LIKGYGGDERHKASAAEELGDEEGSVALRFRGFDPLQARPEDAVLAASLSKYSASVATHDLTPFLIIYLIYPEYIYSS
jgi:hypothetical protein